MRTVTIQVKQLPHNPKYLCDKQGTLDIIGQIITQLSNRTLEPGTRTPCCLPFAVPPLTTLYRETIILAPLGYQLLQITTLPPHQQVPKANDILLPRNIGVVQDPEEVLAAAYLKLNR